MLLRVCLDGLGLTTNPISLYLWTSGLTITQLVCLFGSLRTKISQLAVSPMDPNNVAMC